MTNPVSFESAWTEAERRAFDLLVAAAGSTEGRDAFLGGNPNVLNAWHFKNLDITGVGEMALLAQNPASVSIPYTAECVFLNRARCQEWAMRIIVGLPVQQDETSNIALFRVNAVGQIEGAPVQVVNEKDPVTVWKLRLGLDLVFTTGGKSNAVTVNPAMDTAPAGA